MKQHLRLALPPLEFLSIDTRLAFVLIDRHGQVARAGELTPIEMGSQIGSHPAYAVLHPNDAIVAQVTVPPVSSQRLDAAVAGSIEPMLLSDIEQLCVAHGPRNPDGSVKVAWTARRPLADAWSLLADAGLDVAAFIPHTLAVPMDDPHPETPLALPGGPRWLAPLPPWSLAHESLRPASAGGRWRKAALWTTAAAAIWILGLNGYASRLQAEVDTLQDNMRSAVMQAFPQIPIVIDPVRQAQNQRDALRLTQGISADDDFMPLALATAQVLDFAQGHVRNLQYEEGELVLTLAEGYTPPANEATLAQAAAVQQVVLEKDNTQPHAWRIKRPASASSARKPS
ncbi:type II secretion system protein GspL [Pusillimonas sp.]|uniref:type II secretion system protein GspL n=1 Tax=Pusillimonas sp. TaxID=3040095 RepID=UPI0037CBCD8E